MELPAFLFFLFIACLLSVGGIFLYAVIAIWHLFKLAEGIASEH
ncbi:TPA: hypothetical protein ACK21Z_003168 [Vibrio harveyi]